MCFRKKRDVSTKSGSLEKRGDTYFIDDIEISLAELKNGIEISWDSPDTEFEIIFPDDRMPFRRGFLSNCNSRKSNRKMVNWRLNPKFARIIENELKNGAQKVIIYYAIYCDENKSMAEGNSFPKMIIR